MKKMFMKLYLLIYGPKQPANDLDVYLVPLIKDLKTVWDIGVDVYDAYRKPSIYGLCWCGQSVTFKHTETSLSVLLRGIMFVQFVG